MAPNELNQYLEKLHDSSFNSLDDTQKLDLESHLSGLNAVLKQFTSSDDEESKKFVEKEIDWELIQSDALCIQHIFNGAMEYTVHIPDEELIACIVKLNENDTAKRTNEVIGRIAQNFLDDNIAQIKTSDVRECMQLLLEYFEFISDSPDIIRNSINQVLISEENQRFALLEAEIKNNRLTIEDLEEYPETEENSEMGEDVFSSPVYSNGTRDEEELAEFEAFEQQVMAEVQEEQASATKSTLRGFQRLDGSQEELNQKAEESRARLRCQGRQVRAQQAQDSRELLNRVGLEIQKLNLEDSLNSSQSVVSGNHVMPPATSPRPKRPQPVPATQGIQSPNGKARPKTPSTDSELSSVDSCRSSDDDMANAPLKKYLSRRQLENILNGKNGHKGYQTTSWFYYFIGKIFGLTDKRSQEIAGLFHLLNDQNKQTYSMEDIKSIIKDKRRLGLFDGSAKANNTSTDQVIMDLKAALI